MTTKRAARAGLLTLALLTAIPAAEAVSIKSMEHYFRVSGAVNAAQGTCDVRADIAKLLELGKPYQLTKRDPALEEKMIDLMVKSLNETGARIQDEGHDKVCPELFGLYGPNGTEVPGLLMVRGDQ